MEGWDHVLVLSHWERRGRAHGLCSSHVPVFYCFKRLDKTRGWNAIDSGANESVEDSPRPLQGRFEKLLGICVLH
jgi:hypothetical protein